MNCMNPPDVSSTLSYPSHNNLTSHQGRQAGRRQMGCCYATSQFPEETEPSNEVTRLEPLQLRRSGAIWGLEEGCVSRSPHPWQPQGVLLARVGAAKTVPVCIFLGGIGRQISTNDVHGLWDRSIRVLCSGSPGLQVLALWVWSKSEVCFRNLQAPAGPTCGSRPFCGWSS